MTNRRRNNIGRIAWGVLDLNTREVISLQPSRDVARRVARDAIRIQGRQVRAVRLVPARA